MLSIASLPPRAPPVVLARSPPPSSPFGSSLVPSSIDSCVKDGRRIRVGDCALFQAGDAPPFIGLIRWLSIDKEDCLKVCVNWLYRPADIKLPKGILLEAAPNEVFYSFHKDVITAASLLHPCKIYFLRKGVELPAGISSFVCRRVYDIANKCLWWLTDQDYINERQEEVDHLLDKTQLEMHAAVQSGGRSPKSLNGPTSTQLLKSSSDSVQTSGTSFSSQAIKGKKRDRGGDQGTEPIKRERLSNKPDDVESVSPRIDMIKSEVAKITEKGALINLEGCEKLVHLMQLNRNEKLDLAGRIMLADVIAGTDKIECVSRIVQLRGVPILDDWLQEAHKGKTGDGSSPKESDKGSENLLFALLRALDKLPVNLNALQSCNIGKSVNNLRSHKNPEIQKKARSLVDTWKKRVDAEIAKTSDAKSGGPSTQAVTLSAKTSSSDVPQLGSKATVKTLISQSSPCNKTQVNNKHGHIDTIVKSMPVTPVVMKSTSPSSLPSSVAVGWKDSPGKGGADSSGNYSELPLATAKEENCNSSQSQYNSQSCSSDHAKTLGSSCKEDLRSSTTGSLSASKTFGSSSGHRSFSNGFVGNNASGGQKDSNLCKTIKVSNPSGLSSESAREIPSMDHGNNHRLVVRIPNSGRSPAQSTGGGSLQGPSIKELRHDDVKDGIVRSVVDSGLPPAGLDEELGRETNSSFGNVKGVSSLIEPKSRNSLNALIESFAKFSEPSASLSSGDDIGMNLLASVAAGEMSSAAELVSVSPTVTPAGSPKQEPCTANDEAKSTVLCEPGMAQSFGQSEENPDSDSVKSLLASEKLNDISKIEVKSSAVEDALKIDLANEPAIDESKPADPTCEKTADGTIVVIFDPGGGEDAATWADTESKSANDVSRDQPTAPIASGSTTTSNAESSSSTSKVGEELKIASRLRKFGFNELKAATRNFRPESLLGEGGFGCVFKGWIEENGTAPMKPGTGLTVAVKTLNHDGLQGHKEWLAEVNFLGDLLHPNLVKLIGYCIEDDQRLLVYEFMPRGSLENHLFRRSLPLPWPIRMKIALGAAKGLAFLHEEAERPVIYRDFKTSNILLDADYNSKLSDFGLAKDGPEGDKTHVSTRVMGTYGYAAPEYVMTGHLTSKSDVYSFGVVLLEMMTGRRSMDKNRPNGEHNLVEWARPHLGEKRRFYRLVDPRLEGNFSIKGAQKVAQLAHHCLSRDPKVRPLMSEVVDALKPLLNLKDMASSSYFFQSMQAERATARSVSENGRNNGFRTQGTSFNIQQLPVRSLSNGAHASPYHQFPTPIGNKP